MWEISQETCFAAAHQLRLAPGEGERLHGHNWRVKATVRASRLDDRGFVLDFNDLGRILRELVEPYEHVFLNEIAPYDDVNPSAENIARVAGGESPAKPVQVVRTEVNDPYKSLTATPMMVASVLAVVLLTLSLIHI